MIMDGEKFAEEDALHRKRQETLNSLSGLVYSVKSQLGDKEGLGGRLTAEDRILLEEIVKQEAEWVEEHAKDASLEDLEEKLAGECLLEMLGGCISD